MPETQKMDNNKIHKVHFANLRLLDMEQISVRPT